MQNSPSCRTVRNSELFQTPTEQYFRLNWLTGLFQHPENNFLVSTVHSLSQQQLMSHWAPFRSQGHKSSICKAGAIASNEFGVVLIDGSVVAVSLDPEMVSVSILEKYKMYLFDQSLMDYVPFAMGRIFMCNKIYFKNIKAWKFNLIIVSRCRLISECWPQETIGFDYLIMYLLNMLNRTAFIS